MSALTRDAIRSAVFNQSAKKEVVTFAGIEIELRQPPIGAILMQNTDDRKSLMVKMLIDYCYVPDTEERVFEDTDKEMIMAMPFNKDWTTLQNAISRLTDIDAEVSKQSKN